MIRKEAVVHFVNDTTRNEGLKLNPSAIVDAFPQFLAAYEFNRKLADTGREVIIGIDYHGVGYRQWYLSNIRLLVNLREMHQGFQPFHMFCEALPMFEGVDERLGMDRATVFLKSGAELLIDFICPGQEEHMDKRSYPDFREGRPMRDERNGISPEDRSMLDTVSLMASTAAINYISAGYPPNNENAKKLDVISYQLGAVDRVSAVHRIINTQFAGENGEDILVQNLMTGKTRAAFSRDFGSSQDWINTRVKRTGGGRSAPFEYTDEENRALDAYSLVLLEASEKDGKETQSTERR
ncbi:hypothetical protein D3C76_25230 [compost metagenome]